MKMKNRKKYLILLAALLLCAAMLWGCGSEDAGSEELGNSGTAGDTGAAELLSDMVVYCNGSVTVSFKRGEDGSWLWKDDPDFPLEVACVEELLHTVEELLAQPALDTEKSLEDLGLDSESKYVTVSDEQGQTVTWYLGDKDDNGCYYACVAGDEEQKIYQAPAALSTQINRGIYEMMRLPGLPEVAPESIRGVGITVEGKNTYIHPNSEGVLHAQDTEQSIVDALVQLIAAPELQSCVDYRPSSGAPAICGFSDTSPVMTVEYVNTVGVDSSYSLTLGGQRGEGYCVMLGGDDTIYLIDAALAEAILAFAP